VTSSAATRPHDTPTPRRALAIAAHPDDVEFQCGATLAKWAADGCEVSHLICTDGSKGSWEPEDDLDRLVALRQDEQRAAAQALGATGEVVFLGWPDGELEPGLEQRRQVARVIRELRPDVVFGHDPWKRYRLHPDHRNAGFLAVDGVVAARDPHFFPELGIAHHRPDSLWLFEADEPDHVEDVTGFGDTKVAALLEHVSQFRTTMYIDPDDDGTQRNAFSERVLDGLAATGATVGVDQGETFKRIEPL
jgi:LmbE family N-acetylglucosaminyl deacetylase